MSEQYLAANIALHLTYTNSSGFDAKFLANWRALRDELEMIFGQDSRTLEDTAVALCEAITDFAKTDSEAAAAIDDAKKDLPDSVPSIDSPLYPVQYEPAGGSGSTPPKRPDYPYDGKAKSIGELLDKAQTVDDKLYEAACAELSWYDDWVSWLPRDWTEGGDGYVFVVDKIKDVAKDDVSSYQGAIGSLATIKSTEDDGKNDNPLGKVGEQVGLAKHCLNPDKWDGDAAHDFTTKFLNTYPDVAATQIPLIDTLHQAVKGYQDALTSTYDSYDKVMDETINACNKIIQEESAKDTSVALAALQAAITILAVESGTAAIGYALADAGASIAASEVSVGEVSWDGEKDVTSDTRTGLVHYTVLKALDDTYAHLTEFDDELSDKLGEDYETVSSGRYKRKMRLQLPRPGFADDPAKL